ncbi:small secreted protein [Calocera cornea HHB12733]|uniref:NADH dehydrogenase [ubiquinone] 1 alpha subcomplex subunit 1 n=1 Tax=Calocera cornea HHB12733 TaxID=1353952 RepID=A0A165K8W6_9BASI|nr:small secreted protein [Calocera cornea HHB12733]
MPVPWESLVPFGLLIAMFGVAGTGLRTSRMWQNDWKQPRYSIDKWDDMMMNRDNKLTGSPRGQTSDPTPPPGWNNIYYDRK